MEKEIECFIHDHPLILRDHTQQVEKVKYCSVCELPISSTPMYDCNQCKDFVIHKSCAELPQQMQHPFHPQHPLTLFCKSPYESGPFGCDACGKECASGFGFHCEECIFGLHVGCTSLQPTIRYEGHEHPLTPLELIAYKNSWCDPCDELCDGFVFRCVECDFNIHPQCFTWLPHTVKHKCHIDPLTLTENVFEEGDDPDDLYCDACEEKRNPKHPVYYCEECKFIAHVGCVIDEVLLSIIAEQERNPKSKLEIEVAQIDNDIARFQREIEAIRSKIGAKTEELEAMKIKLEAMTTKLEALKSRRIEFATSTNEKT